jgi:hypothetical protein
MTEAQPPLEEYLEPSTKYPDTYDLSTPVSRQTTDALRHLMALISIRGPITGAEAFRRCVAVWEWTADIASLEGHTVGLWRGDPGDPDIEPLDCDAVLPPPPGVAERIGRLTLPVNIPTADILKRIGRPYRPPVEKIITLGSHVIPVLRDVRSPAVLGYTEPNGDFHYYGEKKA